MDDFWLEVFFCFSFVVAILGIFVIHQDRTFANSFIGANISLIGCSFIYFSFSEFDKIEKEREYEIVYEIPVEVIDNIDTITYKENKSTMKIMNLNSHFGRRFYEGDVILVKRGKAGKYAGWKVAKQKCFTLEIKEKE